MCGRRLETLLALVVGPKWNEFQPITAFAEEQFLNKYDLNFSINSFDLGHELFLMNTATLLTVQDGSSPLAIRATDLFRLLRATSLCTDVSCVLGEGCALGNLSCALATAISELDGWYRSGLGHSASASRICRSLANLSFHRVYRR